MSKSAWRKAIHKQRKALHSERRALGNTNPTRQKEISRELTQLTKEKMGIAKNSGAPLWERLKEGWAAKVKRQSPRPAKARQAKQPPRPIEWNEHLARMPYAEYLETPEWQSKRKAKLQEAEYRCQLCNRGGLLDVHHRTYERRGNERLSDLICLCRDCHAKFHGKG